MKITLLAVCVSLLAACNSSESTASKETSADTATATKAVTDTSNGWISLFDGTTTAGWHSYGKKIADSTWKVVDGALMMDTTVKHGADLVTDDSYENYDLKLEWKISKNGNSGIIFLVQENTAKYKNTYN